MSFCERAAAEIMSRSRATGLEWELRSLAKGTGGHGDGLAGSTTVAQQADQVGIWSRQPTGVWKREITRTDEVSRWADIDLIPAKQIGIRRIALVGESVARGWFYDPDYTVAGALASVLDATAPGRFEV